MDKLITRLAVIVCFELLAVGSLARGAANSGHDSGYVFTGLPVVESSETLKTGITLTANHQIGVTVSENPDSPWYQATFFCQGTSVMNPKEEHIAEATLCEATDGDGDVTWMAMLWWLMEGEGTFKFINGTGKWKGITGEGRTQGVVRERADHWGMTKWEIDWQIRSSPFDYDAAVAAGGYTGYDKGYSFHGPHVTESVTELTNGLVLDANTQKGVIVTQNPDSPFYHSKWRSHDTTIKDSEGNVLGDVLVTDTIGPDGDVVWSYQVWWYQEGVGENVIMGGSGKWNGITGIGRTFGLLLERADDHFMANGEFHWKIER